MGCSLRCKIWTMVHPADGAWVEGGPSFFCFLGGFSSSPLISAFLFCSLSLKSWHWMLGWKYRSRNFSSLLQDSGSSAVTDTPPSTRNAFLKVRIGLPCQGLGAVRSKSISLGSLPPTRKLSKKTQVDRDPQYHRLKLSFVWSVVVYTLWQWVHFGVEAILLEAIDRVAQTL